jgi:NADPH:quinone reductase-like Zn-dependent oxidoreductase
MMKGRVLRFVAPRRVGHAVVEVRPPADGEVLVRTHWSGISGGTELLAYRGELDAGSARDETIGSLGGSFVYPFAYGYSCVGEVLSSRVDGVPEGATAFAFHPHQDLFTVRGSDVVIVDKVEDRLATLFPLVETALQVSSMPVPDWKSRSWSWASGRSDPHRWAAGPGRGGGRRRRSRRDRREAAVLFGVPAVDVTEIDAAVEQLTSGAGVPLVVDATGRPSALAHALELLRHEGEVLVCSWYGTKDVSLPLGREFHRRRLQIRSTQVSTIPARLRSGGTCSGAARSRPGC